MFLENVVSGEVSKSRLYPSASESYLLCSPRRSKAIDRVIRFLVTQPKVRVSTVRRSRKLAMMISRLFCFNLNHSTSCAVTRVRQTAKLVIFFRGLDLSFTVPRCIVLSLDTSIRLACALLSLSSMFEDMSTIPNILTISTKPSSPDNALGEGHIETIIIALFPSDNFRTDSKRKLHSGQPVHYKKQLPIIPFQIP